MSMHDLIRRLRQPNDTKIVLLVADGLGGLPREPGGLTELETARTPNLDRLAAEGTLGLSTPVAPGITPGSGPAHLGLFGYDPLELEVGRGILEALGIGMEIGAGDVAIRANFCTLDEQGRIVDRRAGRISTERGAELVDKLRRNVRVEGVEIHLEPVREYRFAIRLRGPGLEDNVRDTDPQVTGVPPLEPEPRDVASEKTARVAAEFLRQAREVLRDEHPANFLTLRGFSRLPQIRPVEEIFGLRAAAVAVYPMYRGLARLVGMRVVEPGQTLADQFDVLREHWAEFDFFFVHYKYTDSTGEDGDFDRKVAALEQVDRELPALLDLRPDVLMVAGDHSTPAVLAAHSWHPVPFLLHGRWCRADLAEAFNERECMRGSLGTFPATEALPLAMAHAGRLTKYGA
jgi:2,3-bisphosphoglycerate-independent phosphoglycerate mutase